jgi:hypothetical protein
VAYVLTDLLGFTVAEGADICAVDDETFQDLLILARSRVRQRRGVSIGPAVADSDGSEAPDSVWSRLVATMPVAPRQRLTAASSSGAIPRTTDAPPKLWSIGWAASRTG